MTSRELPGGYELDDNPTRIDLDAIHAYLAGESYWAQGRDRALTEQLVRGATRVVGLYAPGGGAQVGFARAVSDGHTMAWLADVYVLKAHRGRGLGDALIREMIDGSSFATARWLLATRDAHDLYARHGFIPPRDRLMERPRQI